MTTARAQPLLADSELAKAHDLLFEAHMLVTSVRLLFFDSDDFATAARLKDIQGRLADEFHAVERLIAASGPATADKMLDGNAISSRSSFLNSKLCTLLTATGR